MIVVFAKAPVEGRVKTRLARSRGDAFAVALARASLEDTWAMLDGIDGLDRVLAWDGDAPPYPAWPQGDGDLGDRLERMLVRALDRAPFAIALGSDSPGLPRAYVEDACEALAGHDAVIGPALDGGFYLLGVRRWIPGLLAAVPWSHTSTCAETLARLDRHGFRTARLPPFFDLDVEDDLERFAREHAAGAIVAPETARVIGCASRS